MYCRADWIQLITGTKSALADNPTTGANANVLEDEAGANVDDVLLEALADPSTSKRSKRKQTMNANNRKAAIAAADPATKLRRELQAERKKVVPSFILQPKKRNTGSRQQAPVEEDEDVEMDDTFDESTSLRDQLRALQRTKDFNLPAAELEIVNTEISRLRKELAEKDKLIEVLRSEQNLFADVYNGMFCPSAMMLPTGLADLQVFPSARVKFYRVMQEFGDSVAVLPDEETTPGALRAEIEKLKTRESDLDHQMLPKIARRRYLDGLRNANLTEEGCLICANTEQGQSKRTLVEGNIS